METKPELMNRYYPERMNRYYVEVKHPWNKNLVSIYVYAYSPEHVKDIIEGELVTIDQTD
tara:strand:+ start:20176 stop:20355 length:180 start_codon:yes stop_codon:yes gene_type:complete